MRAVQFELFPEKVYGIVMADGGLAYDSSVHHGEPVFFKSRTKALQALRHNPQWAFQGEAEVRPIEIHGDPYGSGTIVVGPRKRATRHRRSR